MRIEDFPRPKDDNRRGVHWSASVYHPTGNALDFWISELKLMKIKWVKLLDDGGGSSLELCRRLLSADIMPIVRLYRLEPNPGRITGREEETARHLIAAGVRYFETNNEPDLASEWRDGRMPANWLDIVIDNFIVDADRILALGGLPALPAMGVGSRLNPVARVVEKGRADLFTKGAWVAVHNYTLNHPLDYPYDRVNQEGLPVSQEEYDRLGAWAWEGRSREQINQWRASGKNPGATLADDATCFLAFSLLDEMIQQTLGHPVPIISTEGGPVMGWKDDQRYPRTDPATHANWIAGINDFMQGGRQIHGIICPNHYFAMCFWLLGNFRLGFMAPGWESQSWYTDWWNDEFKLSGQLPVVHAVKRMRNIPVDLGSQETITGYVLAGDTDSPLPDVAITLMEGEQALSVAVTDPDGAFHFDRLSPGEYDLAIAPWGVVRGGVPSAAAATFPVVIRLFGGQSSSLSGKVVDHTNGPLGGLAATLRRGGRVVGVATTRPDGSFRFSGLPSGSYEVSVPGIIVNGIALDGWASRSIKLTIGSGSGMRYVVRQRRALSEAESAGRRLISGTVTDSGGSMLRGIQVRMSWANAQPGTTFPVVTTGKDPYRPLGQYEFVATAGTFAVQVTHGDWPSDEANDLDTATLPGREGQAVSYEVNFALEPVGAPARVDGQVPGAPPGQIIRLRSTDGTIEVSLQDGGAFAFSDLSSGEYSLELPGIGIIADGITLASGSLYKLLFPLRSKLTGQVILPTEGSVAVLHSPDQWGWTRQCLLDPDGAFAFEGLPPGDYRLQISQQMRADIHLNGENSLVLPPIDPSQGQQSSLRGHVADGSGQPKADLMVTLRCDELVVAMTRTTGEGGYAFSGLPGGVYALDVENMGEVAGNIVLDGRKAQLRDVLWREAGPKGVIQGVLRSADGVPQPGKPVRLLRDKEVVAQVETDSRGAYRFDGLPDGVYDLAAVDEERLATGLRLASDATVRCDLSLPPRPPCVLAHYVLLRLPRSGSDAARRLILLLASRYIERMGSTGGFSLAEAVLAARVTIIGDGTTDADERTLRKAGCQVTKLPGSGHVLAAELETLLANLGEG